MTGREETKRTWRSCAPRRALRRRSGSNIVEFCFCLVFIFFVVLIPLCNYGTLMNRGAMINQLVNGWAQSLAKERKLSVAFERIETDDKYMETIRNSEGVKILLAKTSLLVSRVDEPNQMIEVDIPGKIPSGWQPDKGHNNYTLQIIVDAQIQPFITFNFFGLKIPGLTGPADVRLVGHSVWENLGRDPVTKEFYVNE